MHRIRTVSNQDFPALAALVSEDTKGIINLPKDPPLLKKKLETAIASFKDNVSKPSFHSYLFVLEDTATGSLVGVSGIYPLGHHYPLEYFLVKEQKLPQLFPEVPQTIKVLEHVRYQQGLSEIGSLFLAPTARKSGLGKLLSFSRFLFMAAFPERFTEFVYADMRGVIDDKGESPFWQAVGRHFLPISFKEFNIRYQMGKVHMGELMPQHTLYAALLDPKVASIIGETHINTRPALQMLLNQGFKKTDEVDLYDAGPRIMAERKKIAIINQASIAPVSKICTLSSPAAALLSNHQINFRACHSAVERLNDGTLAIDPETAQALEVTKGDLIIYANL